MIVGDTQVPRWPWLRRWVRHNWYTDRRNPDAGFADRDEAAILYNAALQVRGKPCLEIGCWRGWSTVHLALGAGMLDVVDPILAKPEFAESIYRSCAAAGVLDCIAFHTGSSPTAVHELAGATGRKWSLIFIDGDHEGDAPRQDAEAAMRHADQTAMVLFHDLTSPFVAAGLHALRDAGWRTMLYQTMQIMGVAWRGDIEPPDHIPDPSIFWTLPAHLAGYHVSNWKRPFSSSFAGWWPDMTLSDQRDAAMMRAQAAEDSVTELLLARSRDTATIAESSRREARLADALTQSMARGESLTAEIEDLNRQIDGLRSAVSQHDRTVTPLLAAIACWAAEDAALDTFILWLARRRVLLGLLRRTAADRIAIVRAQSIAANLDHVLTDDLIHRLLRRRLLIGLLRRSPATVQLFLSRVLTDRVSGMRGATHAAIGHIADGVTGFQPSPVPGSDETPLAPARPGAGGIVLTDYLRLVGWDAKKFALPGLLRDCLADTKDPAEAKLTWVKRAKQGLQLPCDLSELKDFAARVSQSGLFDAVFYRRRAKLSNDIMDPAIHYVLVGDVLGIAPSEQFNPGYYGARYPDVDAAGLNRLLHYVASGRSEGRFPSPRIMPVTATMPFHQQRENVLVIVHEATRTGAPILGWNIVRHLADRYNVFTAILNTGPLVEAFCVNSVGVCGPFVQDHPDLIELQYGLDAFLTRHKFKYAIVNSCESRAAVECCAERQIPTVMLVHEFATQYPVGVLATAFGQANELVFPAQIVADSALAMHPRLNGRRIVVRPQGLCVIPGKPIAAATSRPDALAAFADPDHFIVVGAGTVEFRKGVDFFLATAMAVNRDPAGAKVRFLWVGRGFKPDDDLGYSMYLQQQLKRSAIHDNVTFLPEVPDMDPVYAIADAFLLTSRLDPMPNVAIDAAHLGIPIVCFRNASGTADVLLQDPETAKGVVDYLDPVAAADAILVLATQQDAWTRRAEATRRLAQSVFDMRQYVDALDALGTGAAAAADRTREDAEILSRTDDFDQDLFLGPSPIFEPRAKSIGRALTRGVALSDEPVRRTAVGFNPAVWRCHHADAADPVDPLAAFIEAGRPAGAWFTPTLRPSEPARPAVARSVKALLYVHCTDTERSHDLLRRLRLNRRRFDLLVTTDSPSKAAILNAALRRFDLGQLLVQVTNMEAARVIESLTTDVRRERWSGHDVIGHIHDGDAAAVDFQWTALLGGRRPMIDPILDAFAAQQTLGLVYPCDPWLPGPDPMADFPSGGMFWARRATLRQLTSNAEYCPNALPGACIAAGLTQAMTHVAGVFR